MFEENDLLKILINYNFSNLYRGEKNVSSFLEEHFNQYICDIKWGLKGNNKHIAQFILNDISKDFDKLVSLEKNIIDIIKTFEDGHLKKAYDEAFKFFDNNKDLFLVKTFDDQTRHYFARVRYGEFKSDDKKELFHIPRNKSGLIGAYRYSVAGFPCLYLANDLELSWYECNMPKTFSYCYMKIADTQKLKLINFVERPMDFFSGNIVNLFNAMSRKQEDIINIIKREIKNYIITYPLVASCSLIVKDRNQKYIAEYIVPQLLMQWIREKDEYDGVIYKSSLNSNLNKGMGAFNIALPVKEFREDGLCENLTKKLLISDINYIDTVKYFEEKKRELIKEILDLKNEIWLFMIHSKCKKDCLSQMIDICDYIYLTYTALIENKYTNSELIFNFINCLDSYIFMFKVNEDLFIQKMLITDGLVQEITTDFEKEKIHEIFNKFLKLTDMVVKRNQGFYITHNIPSVENFSNI